MRIPNSICLAVLLGGFLCLWPLETARGQRLLPGPEQNTLANAPNGVGAKKVAVIMFRFSNSPAHPLTPTQIRQQLFLNSDSTNAYFESVSFNTMSLTGNLRADGDVFGSYTLQVPGSQTTDLIGLTGTLMAQAQKDGFVRASYDAILYCYPWILGRRSVYFGSSSAELNGWNRIAAAHELMHILGVDHANGLRATVNGSPSAIGDEFTIAGYGDPFDLQGGGGGFRHPNAYFKARMGWLQVSNFMTLPMDRSATKTYSLRPINASSSELQCLRIPVPRGRIPLTFGWGAAATQVDLYYYLEFRRPSAFESTSSNSDVFKGVSIRLGTDIGTNHFTMLIDSSPSTSTFDDAPLTVGQIFEDPVAGVTIRTVSTDASVAQVEVTTTGSAVASQGPHMLWSRTDGTASLWRLRGNGSHHSHRYYGPYLGMTASSYQRSDASTAKMLWSRADGLAKIWTLDAKDNVVSVKTYGPYNNWTARSYQRLPDGTARLLWSRNDGKCSIWRLNANDDYAGVKQYGPYLNWTARSYQRLPDGTARLLWSRTDGKGNIWRLNSNDDYTGVTQFGPYLDWTATDYERLPDGTARLIWNRSSDRLVSVWTLNGGDGYVTHRYHGPYHDWSAESFSAR